MPKALRQLGVLLLCLVAVAAYAQDAQSNVYIADLFGRWTLPQGNQGPFSWSNGDVCRLTAGGAPFIALTVGTPVTIVDSNQAHSETVAPTAVTLRGSQCQATIPVVYNHSSFYLESATAGLQEALNAGMGETAAPGLVTLTPKWAQMGGATAMITAAQGSASIGILDERTTPFVQYAWICSGPTCSYQIVGGGGGGGGTGSNTPSPQYSLGYFVLPGTQAQIAGDLSASRDLNGNVQAFSLNGVINPLKWPGTDLGQQLNNICATNPPTAPKVLIPAGTYSIATAITFAGCNSGIDLESPGQGANLVGDGGQHNIFNVVGAPVVIDALGNRTFTMQNVKLTGLHISNGAASRYFQDAQNGIYVENVKGLTATNLFIDGIGGTSAWRTKFVDNLTLQDSVIQNVTFEAVGALGGGQNATYRNLKIANCTNLIDLAYPIEIAGQQYNPAYLPYARHVLVDHVQIDGCPQWEGIDTHGGSDITFRNITVNGTYFGAQLGNAADLGVGITGIQTDALGTQATYSYTNNPNCQSTYGGACPALTAPFVNTGDEMEVSGLLHSIYNTDGPVTVSASTYAAGAGTFTVKGTFPVQSTFLADTQGEADRGFLTGITLQDSIFKQSYASPGHWQVTGYAATHGTPATCSGTGVVPSCAGSTFNPGTPATLTIDAIGTPFKIGEKVGITNGANPQDTGHSALAVAIGAGSANMVFTVAAVTPTQVTFWAYGGFSFSFPNLGHASTNNQIAYQTGYGAVFFGTNFNQAVTNGHVHNVTIDGYGGGYLDGAGDIGGVTLGTVKHFDIDNIVCTSYRQACIDFYVPTQDVNVTHIQGKDLVDAGQPGSTGVVIFSSQGAHQARLDYISSEPTGINTAPGSMIVGAYQNEHMVLGSHISATGLNGKFPKFSGGHLPGGLAALPDINYPVQSPNPGLASSATFTPAYLKYQSGDVFYDSNDKPAWIGSCPSGYGNLCSGLYSTDTTDSIAVGTATAGSPTVRNLLSCNARSVAYVSNVLTIQCNTQVPFAGNEQGLALNGFANLSTNFLNGGVYALTGAATVACTGVSSTNTCTTLTGTVSYCSGTYTGGVCSNTAGTTIALTALTHGNAGTVAAPIGDGGTVALGGASTFSWFPKGMNVLIPGAANIAYPSTVSPTTSTTGGAFNGGQTMYVKVAALTPGGGHTQHSAEASVVIPAGGTTNSVTVYWSGVTGASGYSIAASGLAGAETICGTTSGNGATAFTLVASGGALSGCFGAAYTTNTTVVPLMAHVIGNDGVSLTLDASPVYSKTATQLYYQNGTITPMSDSSDWSNTRVGAPGSALQTIYGDPSQPTRSSIGSVYNDAPAVALSANALYTRPVNNVPVDNVHQANAGGSSTQFVCDSGGCRYQTAAAGTADQVTATFWTPRITFGLDGSMTVLGGTMYLGNTTINQQATSTAVYYLPLFGGKGVAVSSGTAPTSGDFACWAGNYYLVDNGTSPCAGGGGGGSAGTTANAVQAGNGSGGFVATPVIADTSGNVTGVNTLTSSTAISKLPRVDVNAYTGTDRSGSSSSTAGATLAYTYALTHPSSLGGATPCVYFPAGKYSVSGLRIPVHTCTVGDGTEASILQIPTDTALGSRQNLMTVTGANPTAGPLSYCPFGVCNGSLANLTLQGSGAGSTGTLLELDLAVGFHVENVKFVDHGGRAVAQNGLSEREDFRNVEIDAVRFAIDVGSANETYWHNLHIASPGTTSTLNGTGSTAYSYNINCPGNVCLTSGTWLPDPHAAVFIAASSNYHFEGFSIKPTLMQGAFKFFAGDALSIEHGYCEGFVGYAVNPCLQVVGKPESTTTTAAVTTSANITVAETTSDWFPAYYGSPADVPAAGTDTLNYIVYPPDYIYNDTTTASSIGGGIKKGYYECIQINGHSTDGAHWGARGIACPSFSGNPATSTTVYAWPAGAVEEMLYGGFTAPVVMRDVHANSYNVSAPGSRNFNSCDDASAPGHFNGYPCAEVVVGTVPTRVIGQGQNSAQLSVGNGSAFLTIEGGTRISGPVRVYQQGVVADYGAGGQGLASQTDTATSATGIASNQILLSGTAGIFAQSYGAGVTSSLTYTAPGAGIYSQNYGLDYQPSIATRQFPMGLGGGLYGLAHQYNYIDCYIDTTTTTQSNNRVCFRGQGNANPGITYESWNGSAWVTDWSVSATTMTGQAIVGTQFTSSDTVHNSFMGFGTGSGGDSSCPAVASGYSYLCTKNSGISASLNGAAFSPIVTQANVGPSATVLWTQGAGVPAASCGVGSVYSNTSASSASTLLYVCYPANTWTAVTVP